MKFNIVVVACFMLCMQAFAQNTKTEEVVVPLTKANEAGTLVVNLINGSIKVTGTTGKEVVVKATAGTIANRTKGTQTREVIVETGPERNRTKKEETNGLRRIPNDGLNLTVTEQNNTVRVENESVSRSVDLEIQVPKNFNLRLSTVNRGDILISNVKGTFELENVNGDIVLENVSGSAMANTTNGKVKANFLDWNSKNPMAFSTLNGNVDVTLPANAKFDVKLDSDRGQIYSDFDINAVAAKREAGKRSESGVYKVTLADAVTGQVNGGGSEIMMKNMNGNIYLRKK